MTAHIMAKRGEIAEKILLPGDPLRAKFIAENFLEDTFKFNDVRGMLGYTGKYKGKEVSVMGTGMGIPSMAIYSYELIHEYGVKKLIRVGSCGSYQENIKLNDLIFAQAASSDSNYANQFGLNGNIAATASYHLLERGVEIAKEKKLDYFVGNILSSDVFYSEDDRWEKWKDLGVLGVEMESYALYLNAQRKRVEALTILTVSDSFITHEKATSEEREKTFTAMMEIALEI